MGILSWIVLGLIAGALADAGIHVCAREPGAVGADLVRFDTSFTVHNTWVAGQHRPHPSPAHT